MTVYTILIREVSFVKGEGGGLHSAIYDLVI